jgi:hypothetical protein
MVGVTGSIPVVPTIFFNDLGAWRPVSEKVISTNFPRRPFSEPITSGVRAAVMAVEEMATDGFAADVCIINVSTQAVLPIDASLMDGPGFAPASFGPEDDADGHARFPPVTPKVTRADARALPRATTPRTIPASIIRALISTWKPAPSVIPAGAYCKPNAMAYHHRIDLERIMAATPKIADWLGYIRPHIGPYDALGRGERGEYIAKLSKETKLSDNSLRRMIFAAQFLDAEGITALPPGGRLPVGAVERIARIAAREPERRQQLLKELTAGEVTIVELRKELKKSDKAAKRARRAHDDVPLIARAKAELAARGIEAIANMDDVDILHTKEAWYFDPGTRPARAIILPRDRYAVLLDGTAFKGTVGSFMRQRKEFFRNILIGAGLYDFVLVWAPFWLDDVRAFVDDMQPDMAERVIVLLPEPEKAAISPVEPNRRASR